ncbi:MAG: GHKL domain-containing protein [Bacteroidetes bacterium]|nr:GHKL domain-containing protein [Bacteroidota bacterium]
MKRLRWLAVLISITILGIAGFQAFWLKQTYEREKKNLNFKTEVAFTTTIRNLQASKIRLGQLLTDSTLLEKDRFLKDSVPGIIDFKNFSRGNMITTMKALQDKLEDSIKSKLPKEINGIPISPDKQLQKRKGDSSLRYDEFPWPEGYGKRGELMMRLLSGVDSLQDTLKVAEITEEYSKALSKQKINIPFKVIRLDTAVRFFNEPGSNEVTVGFIHPITYKLKTGPVFPYLLGQIASPLIFSLFLVAISVISFLLLYRSLLRQHRLAQLKNDFISNITHELKTPIATVGVAIEALRNFNAIQNPERTKEYLDISSNELQRLSLLVDKVLKLSMFEKREIELKYETLNLKDVVEEVVSSMRLQFEKYRARVSVNTMGDTNLRGDRLHLLSVVFNLLDNALKYSKSDPVIQVEISGEENKIRLNVTDNGIGIPAEYKDKLFEKFFRVPTGDTHNAKGYGLGLSYVAHVVQQHKGTITVESQPGIGSKFIITLPKQ